MPSVRNEQASALAGARVLLVEDEALVALDLSLVLGDLGCIVVGPASDSVQALALVRQRPDVVLLDLSLRDGFAPTLTGALAAEGVPHVLLTTGCDCEQLEPARCQAPRLDKPYSREELRRALLQVLGR